MPDRADDVRREGVAPGAGPRRPPERWLFSGTYGLVLASAMISALDATGETADPASDALWVLLAALASCAAHGYAHVIARRASADGSAGTSRLRSVLAEWPLVAVVLPTVGMLLAALADWWAEETAVDVALLFNTVALFAVGTSAARIAGRRWPPACRAGAMDMLIGLMIIAANALTH
ncbi:hypothetical protein [Streptomyces sp. UH6]|uniref:hypothetical protein n=1 Tax=Streptomyces sp. UH6 TaxID=2748379 RepID=UPI0015D4CE8A|nr:hypothetical protein [Streptomyces sp. UH6]NYV78868.1 hypothetical protein [Streptomyces sp. UH6]